MAEVASALTGNATPEAADLMEFVQQSYSALFGNGANTRQAKERS
jgi:hypothetical protein